MKNKFPMQLSIDDAQFIVKHVKNNPEIPIYVAIAIWDYLGTYAKFVADVSLDIGLLHKNNANGNYGSVPDETKFCRLVEICKDETFIFVDIGFPDWWYRATINMLWIVHPNKKQQIYFYDECVQSAIADKCDRFQTNALDLDDNEYILEFGNGENGSIDLKKPFRIYAKDIMWDGETRNLVCICRHPDALPEDDFGYKRPIINPHSVPLISIPWLEDANDYLDEEFEYPYLNKEMLS